MEGDGEDTFTPNMYLYNEELMARSGVERRAVSYCSLVTHAICLAAVHSPDK